MRRETMYPRRIKSPNGCMLPQKNEVSTRFPLNVCGIPRMIFACCQRRIDRYDRATILIGNSEFGRIPTLPTELSVWAQKVYHNILYRYLYTIGAIVQLLLAIWEDPSYYVADNNTGIHALLHAIDFLVIILVIFDLFIQKLYHGDKWWERGWIRVKVFTASGLLVNLILTIAIGNVPYVLRMLRPIILMERLRNVRKIVGNIVATAPKLMNAGLLLMTHLLVFSAFGFVMFSGIDFEPDGSLTCEIRKSSVIERCSTFVESPDEGCSDYFATFSESIIHMFGMLTAANYPSIMYPAYACNPANALFFVFFMLGGFYILLNLVLAVAYDEFRANMKEETLRRYERIFYGCDLAFHELAVTKEFYESSKTTVAGVEEECIQSLSRANNLYTSGTGRDSITTGVGGSVAPNPLKATSSSLSSAIIAGSPFGTHSRNVHGMRSEDTSFSSIPSFRLTPSLAAVDTESRKSIDFNQSPSDGMVWVLRKRDFLIFFHRFRPDIPPRAAELIFDLFDGDNRGVIYQREFRRLVLNFGQLRVVEIPAPGSAPSIANLWRRSRDGRPSSQKTLEMRTPVASMDRSGGDIIMNALHLDGSSSGSSSPRNDLRSRSTDSLRLPQFYASTLTPLRAMDLVLKLGEGFNDLEVFAPRIPKTHPPPGIRSILPSPDAVDANDTGFTTKNRSPLRRSFLPIPGTTAKSVTNPLSTLLNDSSVSTEAAGVGNGAAGETKKLARRKVQFVVDSSSDSENEISTTASPPTEQQSGMVQVQVVENAMKRPVVASPGFSPALEPAPASDSVSRKRPLLQRSNDFEAKAKMSQSFRDLRQMMRGQNTPESIVTAHMPESRNIFDKLRQNIQVFYSTRDVTRWTIYHEKFQLRSSWRIELHKLLSSAWTKLFFDCCLMLNIVVTLIEFFMLDDEEDNFGTPHMKALLNLQRVTLLIYVAEIVCKMFAWGMKTFFRTSDFHVLDICLIVASFVGTIIELKGGLSEHALSIIAFVRFLRILGIFRVLPNFDVMIGSFRQIMPVLGRYFLVMVFVFYSFAILGATLFEGALSPDIEAVRTSSYGLSGPEGMYIMNFDSLFTACSSLFYLLVQNDWPVIMEGLVASFDSDAPRLYFVFFWIISIVMCVNVITAFIIEAFGEEKQRRDAIRKADLEEALGEKAHSLTDPIRLNSVTSRVDDWIELIESSNVDFTGFILARKKHHMDIYDALYKKDIRKAFGETFAQLRR